MVKQKVVCGSQRYLKLHYPLPNSNRAGEINDNPGCSPASGVKSDAPEPVSAPVDPDMQAMMQAWPALPGPIKAAILTLVNAAAGQAKPHAGGGE